jgi:hypothetical protein
MVSTEMTRSEWTHEELSELKRKIESSLRATERKYPDIRPLPPMDEEEARDLLHEFFSAAAERLLAESESVMMGQLLAAYAMAVEARMLGMKKGRYMVLSEEQLRSMQQKLK